MKKIFTIKKLNEKIWYRLTKVVYILCFAIILSAIVWVNYNQIGTYQTDNKVICFYGNKSTFLSYRDKEMSIYYDYTVSPKSLYQTSIDQIMKECGITEQENLKRFGTTSSGLDFEAMAFTIEEVKVNEFTYLSAILWSMLYMIIAILIFELIKRTFYYIVLGKLKPNKE